jgi:hypothetical protein
MKKKTFFLTILLTSTILFSSESEEIFNNKEQEVIFNNLEKSFNKSTIKNEEKLKKIIPNNIKEVEINNLNIQNEELVTINNNEYNFEIESNLFFNYCKKDLEKIGINCSCALDIFNNDLNNKEIYLELNLLKEGKNPIDKYFFNKFTLSQEKMFLMCNIKK